MRGGCALLVFYAHLFLPLRLLDPVWTPSPRFSWFNLGRPAVLFFFVLSGYVIGLVTTGPATASGIRHYLRHRTARLLPVSTLAVLISWLLLVRPGWKALVGNLLLLQNSDPYPLLGLFPPLENNPNLWSLNYEAVYYLGFILLWCRPQRVGLIFGALVVVLSAHATGLPVPRVIACYASGAFYWLAGLTVAWMTAPPASADGRSNWPAALLTAYAVWTFSLLHSLLAQVGLANWMWTDWTPVSPHQLDCLPVCIWLLLAVTGRARRAQRFFTWICLSFATAGLAGRILSGHWQAVDTVAAVCLAGAWVTARQEHGLWLLRWFAPVGAVSFAIYAIAAPIQLSQRALFPAFAGTALTFAGRLGAVVLLVAASAWLLERRICPPISRWIRLRGNTNDGVRQ